MIRDGVKSEFLQTLQERDFIYQCTDLEQLDALCSKKSITGYIGFDATAKSLQVGNLSAIMLLRWMQRFGHRPIVLVGGGTSLVGDPSFRKSARPLASPEQIQENINGISKVFSRLIDFDDSTIGALLVNNADWLTQIKYIEFLRDYGRNFTVNRMLSFENVKTRLENDEPLSFLEFNYMLMQAYDFHYLNRMYDCVLQMGGSDQWGNIINGVELTRKLTRAPVFGLTAPLVTDSTGAKMGKSAAGAIWLNDDMCLPYDYWQFWRNTDDRDVIRYMKKFTDLPLSEIARLAQLSGSEINEAKKILADEATSLIHGKEILHGIHEAASAVFSGVRNLTGVSDNLPTFAFQQSQLPIEIGDLFVISGMCQSKGEFKKLVAGGGVSVRSEVLTAPKQLINISDFANGGKLLLAIGKKKHVLIVLQ